jgi:flagellar basal-body rod protein FlgG
VIRALSTAATGLEAQQANIERISNDLSNVNTDAYKRSRTEFQDLMYETQKEAGGALGANTQTPVGIQNGLGVRVGATYKIFEQGPARPTYHDYDVMIEGKGFFPMQMPNGEIAYTRNGNFHPDAQGRIMNSNGAQLVPPMTVPVTAIKLAIAPNGQVSVQMQNGSEAILGQVQLVTFPNEQGLTAMGNSLYRPSPGSGAPIQGLPGENGIGSLQQGMLEGSNVDVAKSMVDMITTQRAYEMGTKVMGVADQMWSATANIK